MKKCKVFIALLLVFSMLLGTFPAMAAESDPTFVISSATAAAGESVDVTISLKNNPGIASAKLLVSFDEGLALNKVTYGSALSESESSVTTRPKQLASPVTLNWLDYEMDLEGDFLYATLNFTVSENAVAGAEYGITATYNPSDVYNIDETDIYFAVEAGSITIPGEEVELPEYVISGTALTIGDNTLTPQPSAAPNTLYVFTPAETGYYTVTSSTGTVAWWGSSEHFLMMREYSEFEAKCTQAGSQSWYFGVSGTEPITLTITKTGEYTPIVWEQYENKHTPNVANVQCYTMDTGSTIDPDALTKKGDFYYTADGKLVVVNFNYEAMAISGMFSIKVIKGDDHIDYTAAMQEYSRLSTLYTYYPLTDDLLQMLPDIATQNNWDEWGVDWYDLCATATHEAAVDHVDGVPATCHEEGILEHWLCGVCNQYWSDEALTQVVTYDDTFLPALGSENVEHVPAKAPTCAELGNIEHWYCPDCGGYWLDEACTNGTNAMRVKLGTVDHSAIYVAAKTPNCTEAGNIEHWYCAGCAGYWTDEALTQATTKADVTLPADTHAAEHFEAVPAMCHYEGVIEYWWCAGCDQYWTDAALTTTIDYEDIYVPALGAVNLQHVAAKDPTCTEFGNIEHWFCPDCEQYWTNAACTNGTNAMRVKIAPTGHSAVYVAAKAATCTEDGNIEHWYCAACGGYWTDEELTQATTKADVTLAAGHDIEAFEAVDAMCHYEGSIAYWWCEVCDQYWSDAALTTTIDYEDIFLPALGAVNLQHVAAKAPTCTENGNIEYWHCPDCGQFWSNAACTVVSNAMRVKLYATGHSAVYVAAKTPNCTEDGNIEHWYCAACGSYWTDEALTQTTTKAAVTLPADTHNAEHFEAVPAMCHYEGVIEYWWCAGCDQYWSDAALTTTVDYEDIYLPALGGELQHVAAKAATCTEFGNIEHWYCPDCEQYWLDADGIRGTNAMRVKIPAAHTGIVYVAATEPKCDADGNVEYWYCTDCQAVYLDEELTIVSDIESVTKPAAHTGIKHVEAVAPTCTSDGNVEYWYCTDCGMVYTDEALTKVSNMKNIVDPALPHNIIHVEAVAPKCDADGNIEYWYCADCGIVFTDPELTKVSNMLSVKVGAAHTSIVHVEAVAPKCDADGNMEYWYCSDCGMVYTDEALTKVSNMQSIVVAAAHTGLVHVEAVAPKCDADGNVEFWYCSDCGMVCLDKDMTIISNMKNVVVPAAHTNVQHVEAVAPTCTKDGNVEYWYCADCGMVYLDEELTIVSNMKNVVLPATGHVYGSDGKCTVCDDSPKTGDTSKAAFAAVLMLAAGISILYLSLRGKKRNA